MDPTSERFRSLTRRYPEVGPGGWALGALPSLPPEHAALVGVARAANSGGFVVGVEGGPHPVAWFGTAIGCMLLMLMDDGEVCVFWRSPDPDEDWTDYEAVPEATVEDLAEVVVSRLEIVLSAYAEARRPMAS
jgi:hypothetical protein